MQASEAKTPSREEVSAAYWQGYHDGLECCREEPYSRGWWLAAVIFCLLFWATAIIIIFLG
jgi:hypothetical protein